MVFVATMQVVLMYVPNEFDFTHGAYNTLFELSIRCTAVSAVMFYLANLADVYLFDVLKKKFPNSLWLRNNVCTIACNCGENFLFTFGAFYGVYSASECISIAACTCLIEAIVGLCDTPFVYLGRKVCKKK